MVRYDKSDVNKGRSFVRRKGSSRGFGWGRRSSGGSSGIPGLDIGGDGFPSGGRSLGFPGGGKGGGVAGLVVTLLMLLLATQCSSGGLFSQSASDGSTAATSPDVDNDICNDSEEIERMCFLMGDLNEFWERDFTRYGESYVPTYLNIFTGSVSTDGCGSASSAVGPFYCPAPADRQVYIDLGFYDDLANKFGAPGDFAQSYVIAHEVGHHISNITGDADVIRQNQQRDSANKNVYNIFLELQADCYAGVWAADVSKRRTSETNVPILEVGDLEEGLTAAAEVGDDRIQERMSGQVTPHNWTHGSAEMRRTAFLEGLNGLDRSSCDLQTMNSVYSDLS